MWTCQLLAMRFLAHIACTYVIVQCTVHGVLLDLFWSRTIYFFLPSFPLSPLSVLHHNRSFALSLSLLCRICTFFLLAKRLPRNIISLSGVQSLSQLKAKRLHNLSPYFVALFLLSFNTRHVFSFEYSPDISRLSQSEGHCNHLERSRRRSPRCTCSRPYCRTEREKGRSASRSKGLYQGALNHIVRVAERFGRLRILRCPQ